MFEALNQQPCLNTISAINAIDYNTVCSFHQINTKEPMLIYYAFYQRSHSIFIYLSMVTPFKLICRFIMQNKIY